MNEPIPTRRPLLERIRIEIKAAYLRLQIRFAESDLDYAMARLSDGPAYVNAHRGRIEALRVRLALVENGKA